MLWRKNTITSRITPNVYKIISLMRVLLKMGKIQNLNCSVPFQIRMLCMFVLMFIIGWLRFYLFYFIGLLHVTKSMLSNYVQMFQNSTIETDLCIYVFISTSNWNTIRGAMFLWQISELDKLTRLLLVLEMINWLF